MLESKSSTKHSNLPTFQPSNLVEPFNLGSREISIQDLVIVLTRARAADGAPLAHADAVTRPGARRNQARHLTIHFRHSQLKCVAGKHAIDIGSQHSADVRAWDAYVAALEYDSQFPHPSRLGRAAHGHIGDALELVTGARRARGPWLRPSSEQQSLIS